MIKRNMFFSLLIFFICIISFSSQEADKNWTIKNNLININTFESHLDDTQRQNYYYWIGLRNSFYYSENSNQLEKLVKYFTPEEETYYKNLYNFSAPGLILTGVVILAFFFYLIKRFLLKGCQGPKNVEQSYRYTTYFLIGFGILIGLIFHIFTIYNASVSK